MPSVASPHVSACFPFSGVLGRGGKPRVRATLLFNFHSSFFDQHLSLILSMGKSTSQRHKRSPTGSQVPKPMSTKVRARARTRTPTPTRARPSTRLHTRSARAHTSGHLRVAAPCGARARLYCATHVRRGDAAPYDAQGRLVGLGR